jgi:WhiB family redox-sensing transcriptional regulator
MTTITAFTVTHPPSWQDDAACIEVGYWLFFPETGEKPDEAKRVCAGCDVRAQCLAAALANPTTVGVWGGTTERDRRVLRRRGAA